MSLYKVETCKYGTFISRGDVIICKIYDDFQDNLNIAHRIVGLLNMEGSSLLEEVRRLVNREPEFEEHA